MARAKAKAETVAEVTEVAKAVEVAAEVTAEEITAVEVELSDKYSGHTGIILDGHVIKFVNGVTNVHPTIAEKLKAIKIVK